MGNTSEGTKVDITRYEVPVDQLTWSCDPDQFEFDCTLDLAPLREFIGQQRAIRAIEFGLSMDKPEYNIYVAGLTGTGKTSVVKSYIDRVIKEREAKGEVCKPDDWCYLYNFGDIDRPQIVSVPQGQGKPFRDQMISLLDRLRDELKRAFSSEEYKAAFKKAVGEGQGEQQQLFEALGEQARREGFLLEPTPVGPALIPVKNGKPMSQEEYTGLDENTRRKLETKRSEFLKKLQEGIEKAQDLERKKAEAVHKLEKDVAEFTTSRLFADLMKDYSSSEKICKYLTDLKAYTLDNVNAFKGQEEAAPAQMFPGGVMAGRDPFLPFQVNVFVDNSKTKGPPVILESNPIFGNVFGRIERRFLFGGYLTDHTMIKAGALSMANGGYLILNAQDVLLNVGVWPALKRSIKTQEVRIEDPYEQFGLIAPQGMRPEPVPTKVKIILTSDARLYQLLSTYDEEFWETFKVKADFNSEVERSKENIAAYAAFISGCCKDCDARPFDRTGVARVIEHAARLVADQERLSSRFAQIREVVEEAEHWAKLDGAQFISAQHVTQAIEEKRFRHNLMDERIRDMITRGTIMIDVKGGEVGQVNGLSVYALGDIMFGKPSRITARTFLGRSGIVNIERESHLSGNIHNKGVLILAGFMGSKYAQDKPLSLSASLCFEQSYEGVEGDSASSTELYAVLSSLSDVPLAQSIAVTGSVNQKGEVQPIGGVNHKIEGFFEVCKAQGLTGDQGVLIPHKNLTNLMLRADVREAVAAGKFHIYAARTIDEGMEVLTRMPAGTKKDGKFPEGSINFLVDKNLREMAEKLKGFQEKEEKSSEKKENNDQQPAAKDK